jgi:hypothetical protein
LIMVSPKSGRAGIFGGATAYIGIITSFIIKLD